MTETAEAKKSLHLFLIAGEESGDQLGARLMEALTRLTEANIRFSGVGGRRMQALGLASLFPMQDLAVMGLTAVLARLPLLRRRFRQTVAAIAAAKPDALVLIDSPDFTHRVGRAIRARHPAIRIIAYVSPSVWAWRPGRARAMAEFVDRLLAILPFEPSVHEKLGGPPTLYVGHPLSDKPDLLLAKPGERTALGETAEPLLLLLPGSRVGEVKRVLPDFSAALSRLAAMGLSFRLALPAVPLLADFIRETTASWSLQPEILLGEEEKLAAFRQAHAALAVSGTVTLELALAGVPMVVVYRRDPLFWALTEIIRRLPGQIGVTSMVLPNIILQRNIIPEYLDGAIKPEKLAADLALLLRESGARHRQMEGFRALWPLMRGSSTESAAEKAAKAVLASCEEA